MIVPLIQINSVRHLVRIRSQAEGAKILTRQSTVPTVTLQRLARSGRRVGESAFGIEVWIGRIPPRPTSDAAAEREAEELEMSPQENCEIALEGISFIDERRWSDSFDLMADG
ncbi:hypothetical protein [Nocardia sp. NPDC005745]|uniref:hypothetical protein n=1 Tax=Nocardia sp. NPDC005745 TaxID=3157061 RepID=UPI003411F22D